MSASAPFSDHQVVQAKAGTTVTFVFSQDELKYTLADKTSSTTFKTTYITQSRDRGFLVERNTWLFNVGLLWIALGAVLTVLRSMESKVFVPSFWLFFGAGCAAWAWWQTIRYLKIPCDNGTLLIIEDAQKDVLVAELEARKLDQLRRWHDFIDANEDVARQRSRFEWLREEGAIDADALAERLDQLDRLQVPDRAVAEPALPGDGSGEGSRLN